MRKYFTANLLLIKAKSILQIGLAYMTVLGSKSGSSFFLLGVKFIELFIV